jgi:hypothetical protein
MEEYHNVTEVKFSRTNDPVLLETSQHRNLAVINLDNKNPAQMNLEGKISWLGQTAFNSSSQLFKNKKGHVRIQTEQIQSFLTE